MNLNLWKSIPAFILCVIFTACTITAEPGVDTQIAESDDPMAAVETVNASVTLIPPTPVGGVKVKGPTDYVGIVQQAWSIIYTDYVSDDFNGADWPAVYDEYVALAEEVTSREELWDLLDDLVGDRGIRN